MRHIENFHELLLKYSGSLLFFGACLIGVFTFGEYGVAWDEGMQRDIGLVNWNCIFNNDPSIFTFPDRDHGASFEIPLIFFEKVFGLTDLHDIYQMRHLVSHLFFLTGGLFCFLLIDLLYKNKILSIAGFLLFILHPHIYAHSFFNTKDVPFLSLFTICFYLMVRLFKNKTVLNSLLLGFCLGLLINMRLMGILLAVTVIFFLLLNAFQEKSWRLHLKVLGVISISFLVAVYVTWPYLWRDPFASLASSFKNMSHFGWQSTNLFMGKQVPATEIGWEYIPVWFGITTPILYLLLALIGIGAVIYFFVFRPLRSIKDLVKKSNFIFLICFFAPVAAVIFLRAVVYDGWRHLFFIYPSFVLLLIYGLHLLIHRYKMLVLSALLIAFFFVGGFMIMNAPFQHLYFNSLVTWHQEPDYIRKHYDLDYWGTSYKQSLEYILANDTSSAITVCVVNDPGLYNYEALPSYQRKRLHINFDPEKADYFVTNYRWHPEDYPFEEKKIWSLKVLNNTVNSVFKLK